MTAHDYAEVRLMARARQTSGMPSGRDTEWTDKEVKVLMDGLANKDSYQTIADRLGVTRNTVGGKVYRMNRAKKKAKMKAEKKPLVEISWDRRTFETWQERKERLAKERAGVRP